MSAARATTWCSPSFDSIRKEPEKWAGHSCPSGQTGMFAPPSINFGRATLTISFPGRHVEDVDLGLGEIDDDGFGGLVGADVAGAVRRFDLHEEFVGNARRHAPHVAA